MENIGTYLAAAGGLVTALGGWEFIRYMLNRRSNSRIAEANAGIKEIEKDERELGVMKQLVESLQKRIEQQDEKIKELNGRMDKLYEQLHERERENNSLVRENNELRLALKEAEHNLCVRPDDECFKGRLPKRTYCRLKKLANGDYDSFYDDEETENEESGKREEKQHTERRNEP